MRQNQFPKQKIKSKKVHGYDRVYKERQFQRFGAPRSGFNYNYCLKRNSKGLFGYVNHENGDWLIPPTYLQASSFINGVAGVVNLDGTKMVIDFDNKRLISPPEYSKFNISFPSEYEKKEIKKYGKIPFEDYY